MGTSGRELAGQVALVTGSARNIGRAINLALADAGAKVAINALTSGDAAKALAEEIRAAGGEAMAVVADIRDPAAVQGMVDQVVEQLGGLSIVVNNASLRKLTPLDQMTLERWREVMAVTVEGAMLCTVAALPHLRAAGNGTVLNISG
ncbi:MAG: SDR family NAD(P)-dependent oxidoreductase, partial [Ottowia sp.]|nr:SDR family NAD(P)-dependent oxidoreductase [Ottowia sp.]